MSTYVTPSTYLERELLASHEDLLDGRPFHAARRLDLLIMNVYGNQKVPEEVLFLRRTAYLRCAEKELADGEIDIAEMYASGIPGFMDEIMNPEIRLTSHERETRLQRMIHGTKRK